GLREPSDVDVQVLLPAVLCTSIVQGGEYRLSGTLARASWNPRALLLTVAQEDAAGAVRVGDPPAWRRAVHAMQRRFFAVADGLSDQGRVLVPGLTLGVLGQDALTDGEPVDEVYARRLEEGCRRAGIIHLMAVSGGHYALLVAAATALCSRLLAPRWVVAASRAVAVGALTAVLVPSESITRAVVMHLLSLGYVLLGRREQTTPLLLWTAIVAIVARPARAADFGFALSCAAVLGITLVSGTLAAALRRWLPHRMADALATTIGAQMFTAPLQLLMQPRIALWAVPANLLVAPWMDMATVCGLGAYALGWCMPRLGFALAWCASLGTKSIEIAADVFGADEATSTLSWPRDADGALRLAGAEALVLLIAALTRAMAHLRAGQPRRRGFAAAPSPVVRLRQWHERTFAMLVGLRWRRTVAADGRAASVGAPRHRTRSGRPRAPRRRKGERP
ncbi:competence protein, partial [Bifidobacterium italicum]